MLKLPSRVMDQHLVGDNFINIDDWTEDFDSPTEYNIFIENFTKKHE